MNKILFIQYLILFSVNFLNGQNQSIFNKINEFDLVVKNYSDSTKLMSEKQSNFLDNYGKIYIYPIVISSGLKLQTDKTIIIQPIISTFLLTYLLKYYTKRERPSKKNMMSFPSGHTSGSFVSAWILNSIYGIKLGFPAFIFATGVGIQRIHSDNHWFSDVIAGALIGSYFGFKYKNIK